MPEPRVLDLSPGPAEPHPIENFLGQIRQRYVENQDKSQLDEILQEYQANRNQENAWEDMQLRLETSDISPTRRLQAQNSLNNMRKTITEKDKALNASFNKGIKTAEERELEKQRLINDGYPIEEAEIYVDSPPSVKASLERNHRMEKARGIRMAPEQKESKVVQDQEIAPIEKESKIIPDQAPISKEKEWPEIAPPSKMIPAEQIKWQNNNEKENIKNLKEVEKKKKGYRDNGILIASMSKVNESKKLPSGLGKMVVIDRNTGDIRPTAQLAGQINPETELYVKNLKQYLKGAKDFFGARVTNFDVSSFMQQLPSLLNSEQGRRLILKQMQLVNDLESIHANELDEGIKHYGRNANYIDISRTVDERVATKEKVLLNKIDNVVDASKELEKMSKNPDKFRGSVLMQTDKGEWKAVKQDLVPKYESKGWSVY